MIYENHPISSIQKLIDQESESALLDNLPPFQFHYYFLNHEILDSYSNFSCEFLEKVKTKNIVDEFKNIEIYNSKTELVFSSLVEWDDNSFHIPMIDFIEPSLERCMSSLSEHRTPMLAGTEFSFYSTGRSFHAYGHSLIPSKMWNYYMGSLLLINQVNEKNVVDTRWVGHSLRKGCSCLRWTRNNKEKYLAIPKLVAKDIKI